MVVLVVDCHGVVVLVVDCHGVVVLVVTVITWLYLL